MIDVGRITRPSRNLYPIFSNVTHLGGEQALEKGARRESKEVVSSENRRGWIEERNFSSISAANVSNFLFHHRFEE